MEFKSQLDKYLYKKRMTVKEFEKISGLSKTAIYKFLNKGTGSKKTAYMIEKLTDGEVHADSILKKPKGSKDGS